MLMSSFEIRLGALVRTGFSAVGSARLFAGMPSWLRSLLSRSTNCVPPCLDSSKDTAGAMASLLGSDPLGGGLLGSLETPPRDATAEPVGSNSTSSGASAGMPSDADLASLLESMSVLADTNANDDDAEGIDSSFSAMMEMMQKMKQQAHAAKLPDAQRKARAEMIALNMFEAMGGGETDDDGGDDEVDEST